MSTDGWPNFQNRDDARKKKKKQKKKIKHTKELMGTFILNFRGETYTFSGTERSLLCTHSLFILIMLRPISSDDQWLSWSDLPASPLKEETPAALDGSKSTHTHRTRNNNKIKLWMKIFRCINNTWTASGASCEQRRHSERVTVTDWPCLTPKPFISLTLLWDTNTRRYTHPCAHA